MQTGIKKEKSELSIITSNLNNRKGYGNNKSATVVRPDTLEIKKKPDNVSKSNISQENVNWCCDNFDNFITHLKHVNNTPSPITPTSFFNPSDVTQEQEQFADTLTVHLNKIKEEYKSSIESTESNYVNNVLQLSSVNEDRPPLQITTVSVGNKVYLLNQIPTSNVDEMSNLNYNVIDLPAETNTEMNSNNNIPSSNTIILQQKNTPPINTSLSQQLKISNIASLRTNHCGITSTPNIVFSSPNIQSFTSNFNNRINNNEITTVLPLSATDINLAQNNTTNPTTDTTNPELIQQHQQPVNILKTPEGGLIYTRLPDGSHTLLSNLSNSIINNRQNDMKPIVNILGMNTPPQLHQPQSDNRCLSVNSSATESSNGGIGVLPKKESMLQNNSKPDLDEQQRRLERKRARNRDAARKCRDRKNTLILTLEQKYAKQSAEKDLIRDKLLKSLEEIRRLTDYIAKLDPDSNYSNFNHFLQEIKINELTDTDLIDLNPSN